MDLTDKRNSNGMIKFGDKKMLLNFKLQHMVTLQVSGQELSLKCIKERYQKTGITIQGTPIKSTISQLGISKSTSHFQKSKLKKRRELNNLLATVIRQVNTLAL